MSEPKETKPHWYAGGLYLLPNLFTTGALFAGFYAVVAAMQGLYDYSAIAIFIAMVLDGFDGRVARLTNTQSEFGKEFDSLSDIVCFGVAPALVIYSWSLVKLGKIGWLIAFFHTVSVAIRLARFNCATDETANKNFIGLPCPSAAALLAAMVWSSHVYNIMGIDKVVIYTIASISVILSFLMVSNIPFKSFKDLKLSNRPHFLNVLIVVLIIVLITLDPPLVLLAFFSLYCISGPLDCFITKIAKLFSKADSVDKKIDSLDKENKEDKENN